ncbi:hypothetical protein F0L74_21500 [Chitinophaga agrisoli]|uniref:Dolichyl-phosphate-mannose-protein mannosyltransferase n=1 Tax=Chitinophaga agrisoli TaxID=2607653 RepID=A0A5B2VIQ7_9BACT|nr:hypothetical protein [Chitinophaga agrisoli]KAA2238794.1 hypothetical protein F0L74_21500 [Chitinophaga agrisoli]
MDKVRVMPYIIPEESFERYLFGARRKRLALCLLAMTVLTQFIVFKYFYPYASYIHGDSFAYLETAYDNLDINFYMVGYSRFLRLFSVFCGSDTGLVAFQYLFIQCSCLFFLFTLFYFYKPGRLVRIVLIGFIIINPLFLYLANLISSDAFFAAVSFIWLGLLIWIIHRPNTQILIWHTLVLFIAFSVRYNALIYPAISALAFLLSNQVTERKIVGIVASVLVCSIFVFYTGNRYKELTGVWQYSPFGGWQVANNAMYAYRYVDNTNRKPVPARFRDLDNMVRTHFDSTRDFTRYPNEAIKAGTFYMWSASLPLSKYKDIRFKDDTVASRLKKWATVAPIYADYGICIIKQYPWEYCKYFLLPNAIRYYAPPLEYLNSYNSGYSHVDSIAQRWFNYKTNNVYTRLRSPNVEVLYFYPILFGLTNTVLIVGIVCFTLLKGFKRSILFNKGLLLGTIIWSLNAVFTISSSSAALRFQSFFIVVTVVFTFLLIDYLWAVGKIEAKQSFPYKMGT